MNFSHLYSATHSAGTLVMLAGLTISILPVGIVNAQNSAIEAAFADDFSIDSIRYSAQSFFEVPGSGTARISDGAMVLTAEQGDYPDYGNIFVTLPEATDTLLVTGNLSSLTALPTGTNAESAVVAVEQRIYNTVTDGGQSDGSGIGDVQARFDFGMDGEGNTGHQFCIGEQTADNFEPVNLFDGGTNSCTFFESVTIETDVDYTYGFSIDREAKTLSVIFDDNTLTVEIPGPVFEAEGPFAGFQLIHRGAQSSGGTAQAVIRSITTDSGTDTISAAHSIGRYSRFDIAENRSASIVGEKLRLSAQADDNDGAGIQIRMADPTEYLEATIELSSESDLAASGKQNAEMRADLYNDTADGGFNGREGEVVAHITFSRDNSGQRRIEYCLRRIDDAEDNEQTGLLDGEQCKTVPILAELDVPYRIAIALDRQQASITYRVNGFVHKQAINTGIFLSSEQSMQIGTYADALATTVLLIDDLRTAPESLTASERAAELTTPADFPAPAEAANLVADSTFSAPVFDDQQDLDYVDDFSTPTMRYGFWDGRDRGEVAVSGSAALGYVEFQVNSEEPDNGNYAEFKVDGSTDSLAAMVSLSSESALPVDSDAQATARIQGTFYNDTADGGIDERLGDIYVSLQIRVRGDGRRDASLYIERRAADGSQDQEYDIPDLIGVGENVLDSFVPELDTPYTLSLSIDRTMNTLTASIDNVVQTLSMPTEMFTPARSDKQIQISHRGSSGRAVGRIYSITTNNSTTDFSTDFPVLGPYRPAFNADYPGIDVEYEDGRVRMVVDSALTEGRGADLQARGTSDFLGASMMMSSETVRREGTAAVGIGGLFYNDIAAGGTDGATGSVFATIMLAMKADRDGTPVMVAEYCAFRSLDASFDESDELIGGDTDFCPRFTTPVMTEIAYDMSIQLDTERKVLIYKLGDEVIEYAITGEIYAPHNQFNGARVRASDGALAVGFADNLSYSANPVSLANSNVLFPSNTVEPLAVEPPGSSTSSSSGCSISSNSNNPLLPFIALTASLLLLRRSRRSLLL